MTFKSFNPNPPGHLRNSLLIALGGLVAVACAGAFWFFSQYPIDKPVVYDDAAEHFSYGSIGGDTDNGLPLRLFEVLPTVFGDLLPPGAPKDWTAFGLIQEPGHAVPVGFSQRTKLIPLIGMNCALCHTGMIRSASDTKPAVVRGMGSTTLDLGGFFGFLFHVVNDPRYQADTLLAAMDARAPLSFVDRILYRRVIEKFQEGLKGRQELLKPLFASDHPPFGPGRVDTFNPYKLLQHVHEYPNGLIPEEAIGTARYPSIWNQAHKRERPLNWDGNTTRVQDRNVGAAFGAGATPESLDLAAIDRIQHWLEQMSAPQWPFGAPAAERVARGSEIYKHYCHACHDPAGSRMGEIVPVEEIGSDRHRLDSYTQKLNTIFLKMGEGKPWKLEKMQKTNGYANRPLDGLWARAPYLHNGSVPTLWDLLQPEALRNGGQPTFRVGHAVYDPVNVGIRTDVAELDGRPTAEIDLRLPGNSNKGHSGPAFGTELRNEDKWALMAYMKTL